MSTREESEDLPPGTFLRLDDSVRRFSGDAVLIGGSPLRLLKLGERGARAFDRWAGGEAVDGSRAEQRLARRLLDAGLVHPDPPNSPFGLAGVTLVAPVKNNRAGLRRLMSATEDIIERIVVDDGSAEPVPEAVLRNEKPMGPAVARNAGWQRARTELVAFLDSDVVPDDGWLNEVMPLFSDPEVVAVAPRVRSLSSGASLARYEADRSSLDLGDRPAPVHPMSRVSYVPSAALVVRRSALSEVGGFDARLRFGEDVDLVWRLIERGRTVRYAPTSIVWHDPRARLLPWMRQRFDYGTSAAPLSIRHPRLLHCAKISRWSALSWGLLVAGHPPLALVVAAVTTGLFPRKLRVRGIPATEALRLAGLGHLGAGRILAEATRRTWWPLVAVAAPFSRTARVAALAALLPCFIESVGEGPRWAALRVLDDLAYGAGVWAGCLRERTAEPLSPQFIDDSPTRHRVRTEEQSLPTSVGWSLDRISAIFHALKARYRVAFRLTV